MESMPEGAPVGSLQGQYLLLVETDADSRAVLSAILRYCGAFVRGVASVDEAWASMQSLTPDALVIAIRPPTDTVLTLVRRLRSLRPEDGGKTPVVGLGPGAVATSAQLNGCDGYLKEPIDPWALCRVVSELTS